MMDALVERRILRVFYKQLLATDRQGIAKEGVFKEKQCVTLLRPYTECLFSAVVDKTLEHQAKLYAKANGATGFCYGELQIRFGLSRRSARTLMLPLAQAGHLGSLEGVHQVSWDATVRAADAREPITRRVASGGCVGSCAHILRAKGLVPHACKEAT